MPESKKRMAKTKRILSIYNLFLTCEEVSMQEIRGWIGKDWNDKTISRDIKLLKSAGLPIRYSKRKVAFILIDENGKKDRWASHRAPIYTETDSKKARLYIDKIARLTRLMYFLRGSPDEPCEMWYRETFSEISKRTMQRDFALLDSMDYLVKYKRAWEDPYYKELDEDQPPGHYYFTEPYPYGF